MESNRKRRGFMKGKLMPFYRAAKPSTTSMQYSSKVKPSQASPNTAAYSVGFMDYVIAAQPNQTVSFIVPAADHSSQLKQQFDHKHYGAAAAGDESVDIKAATYISSVQERFKLERINS
ncbi:hypothetical protein PRUPE_3G308000 [Prunus persica]|uniref:Uncharacterized protein n=1 Tax=Prunus persica TaxID=3760 RepID=M5XBB9_PRUPE|nr:uncharacterized protein LOC18782809 [Prunus persica]ONI19962.1 hypothetical protein PRUPE_3G308000 [Prunus persica]